MRRWLLPLLLFPSTLVAATPAGDRATGEGVRTRVLRAGDGVLRVEVVGVADAARADELQRWAAQTARAARAAFGRYPLREATLRIEQVAPGNDRRASDSPVPWGQTLRRDGVAVLLYVRDDASYADLLADWTAVHELSHLFHPYLGDDGRWLAEGLASYYQNVLRARVGQLDTADAWRRLDAGFGRGRRETSALPLDELSRRHRGTMRVYWAGAAYWLEADIALRRTHHSSLDAVLSQYARCCLQGAGEVAPERFVAQLDDLAGAEVFTPLYRRYVHSTAFPSLASAYAALGIDADTDDLRFSTQRDAARLRAAVMTVPVRTP